MKKLLILVKAHDKKYANYYNNLYEKLFEIINKYIHNFNYCQCFFLLGDPNLKKLYKLKNYYCISNKSLLDYDTYPLEVYSRYM